MHETESSLAEDVQLALSQVEIKDGWYSGVLLAIILLCTLKTRCLLQCCYSLLLALPHQQPLLGLAIFSRVHGMLMLKATIQGNLRKAYMSSFQLGCNGLHIMPLLAYC